MNARRLSVCSLVLLLTAGTALAAGEHGFRGGPHHFMTGMTPGKLVHRLERVLELGEAQKAVLDNVARAVQPQFEALHERARENAKALRSLDAADAGYATALQNLATEAGDIATQAVLLHGRLRADIGAELTDEQRRQLAAAVEQRREHHRQHRRERRGSRHDRR